MEVKYVGEKEYSQMLNEACKCYYVNSDAPIAKPSRKAKKCTPSEFKDIMEKYYYQIAENASEKKFTVDRFINLIRSKNKNLKDLLNDISKVKFDWENCDKYGDIRTNSNGVSYVTVRVGGDWEIPVIFAVYYDGKKFRGYIPTHGNSFDRKRKVALGNNDELDNEYVKKETNGKCSSYQDVTYNMQECIKDINSHLVPC